MTTLRPAWLLELPHSAYAPVHDLQRRCAAARHSRRLERDLIIVTEHESVFTLGRRGSLNNLLVPREKLESQGIDIISVERGGDITYHGPGQLVVYPIYDLAAARCRVVELVETLEEAMIRTAADWGVTAKGDNQQRGAWVGGRKLGSVGITVRRSISFHGMALNVNTDLTPFTWLNPCGIPGCAMTSLAQETGHIIPMPSASSRLTGHLAHLLGLELSPVSRAVVEELSG